MTTKPSCRKCNDTGLSRPFMLQCDCPAGAIFAGAPGEPAPPAAPLPPDPSTSAALELAELRRRVPELEDIIARGSAANEKQHAELVELRSAIDAGDKTVTALRERAELAEAQRDNLQRELDATRAAAADTARVDATEVAREVDAARKKAK